MCKCGKVFFPLRYTHKACYFHSDLKAGHRKGAACSKCGQHNRLAPGTDKFCLACITSTKSMQGHYYDFLEARDLQIQPPGDRP